MNCTIRVIVSFPHVFPFSLCFFLVCIFTPSWPPYPILHPRLVLFSSQKDLVGNLVGWVGWLVGWLETSELS